MKRTGLFVCTLLFALTLVMIPAPTPVAAQGGGKILFSSDRLGSNDIYVMNADGSNQIPLLIHPADESGASWSVDGSRIAFVSDRDGNAEIYVMNSDGSNLTRLTYNDVPDYAPDWSPDGRIAFHSYRDGNWEIYVMNGDGSNQIRLTYSELSSDVGPSWSPDGEWIAYSLVGNPTGRIMIVRPDGTDSHKLTDGNMFDFTLPGQPDWSPDGTKIAFIRGGGLVARFDNTLHVIDADGSNEREVLLAGQEDVSLYRPVWSPDGSTLAFIVRHEDLGAEIGVTTLDGSSWDLISRNAAYDNLGDWIDFATPAEPPSADARCFEETGFCIDGRIREYWEQNGGLPVFGLPIGPQQPELIEGKQIQAQWFERNRLELHPENDSPYDVLLGRLGADRLAQQGYDWQSVPQDAPQDSCRYFEETGRNVCGDILASWRANGLELDGQGGFNENENLALFGLPLTGMLTMTTADGSEVQVQYFERARFELHPENDPPFNVLLGLLGSEVRGAR